MATTFTAIPTQPGRLTVDVEDISMLRDIKKAISMVKGVTKVQKAKPKDYDITKTAGYREAMDDVKHGRIHHAESVDDMFKDILGEDIFNTIRRSNV